MLTSLKNLWIIRYVRESYIELKKVVWPSQETVRKHTILVIAISVFVAAYFGFLDYYLNKLLQFLV